MSSRSWSMQSLPTARRWSVYILLAVVFAIACAYLSHWQFTRNAERSTQLDLVARNYDATPTPLAELVPVGGSLAASDEWRPVLLHGSYLVDRQLLARNRAQGGSVAYEVLTPLRLDDGRVFIVDRGWIPLGETAGAAVTVPAPPSGTVTVTARLRPGEALPASGRGAPAGQVPTINLPLVAETTGRATVTAAYGIVASEQPAAASMPHALDRPTEDPGPYLSYAVQWILFAIMGFVFIGYVIRTETMHRREDAAARAAAIAAGNDPSLAPRPRRPRRRVDRDMRDEDDILDAAPR